MLVIAARIDRLTHVTRLLHVIHPPTTVIISIFDFTADCDFKGDESLLYLKWPDPWSQQQPSSEQSEGRRKGVRRDQ